MEERALGMAGTRGWCVVWAGCGACVGSLLNVAVSFMVVHLPRGLLFVFVALLRGVVRATERAERQAGAVKQADLDLVQEDAKSSDDEE